MGLNMIDVSNNNYISQVFKHKELSNSLTNYAEIGLLHRMGVENENFELIGFPITLDMQLLLPLNLKAELSEENPLHLIIHDGEIKHNIRDLEAKIKDLNGIAANHVMYNKEILFVGENYIPESEICNISGCVIYVKDIQDPNKWHFLFASYFGYYRIERLDSEKNLSITTTYYI